MKSRKTIEEFSLDEVKKVIAKEMNLSTEEEKKMKMEVILAEVGDDRFGPTRKEAVGVRVTLEK